MAEVDLPLFRPRAFAAERAVEAEQLRAYLASLTPEQLAAVLPVEQYERLLIAAAALNEVERAEKADLESALSASEARCERMRGFLGKLKLPAYDLECQQDCDIGRLNYDIGVTQRELRMVHAALSADATEQSNHSTRAIVDSDTAHRSSSGQDTGRSLADHKVPGNAGSIPACVGTEATASATAGAIPVAGAEPMTPIATAGGDQSALEDAADEIAKLCGAPGWEYPRQLVRDVRQLVERLASQQAELDGLRAVCVEINTLGQRWRDRAETAEEGLDAARDSAAKALDQRREATDRAEKAEAELARVNTAHTNRKDTDR